MNSQMTAQISNMIHLAQNFETACQLAAMQDDGKMSGDEKRALKKTLSAFQKFRKSLEKIE